MLQVFKDKEEVLPFCIFSVLIVCLFKDKSKVCLLFHSCLLLSTFGRRNELHCFGRTAACELLSSSFLELLSSSFRAHASLLLLALKGGKRMGRRERGVGLVLWGYGAVQVCTIPALVLTATSLSANIYMHFSPHLKVSQNEMVFPLLCNFN
jgi:hypothetical protein